MKGLIGWLFVFYCACLWSRVQGYQLYLYVDGQLYDNGATVSRRNGDSVTIKCQFDWISSDIPTLVRMYNSQTTLLQSVVNPDARTVSYTVPEDYRQGTSLYLCQDTSHRVQVTLSYSSSQLPTTTDITPSTSTGSNFTGLNPLIYTISAVILLGSLAIVAIITCWIRARRSFNNRSLRSAQTAQDYFDYLSDNEFTPLTSEEFQASLQERPPTYNQSEQIQTQGETEEESTAPSTPPPERTIPPEEAAIIENLIALNLLPEDSRPAVDTRRLSPRIRRVRVQATPTLQEATPPEEDEGHQAVEQLRSIGARAQRLLNEQQSTGELVSLDSPNTEQ